MINSYQLAGSTYKTKAAITVRCQAIIKATATNERVAPEDQDFLLDLLSYHTEWPNKAGAGVTGITTMVSEHGTRCLNLIRADGTRVDISYLHALKHLPSPKTATLLPQGLIDFRNGARQAIKDQVDAFRAQYASICAGQDMAVDHVYPKTFDALLFSFCQERGLNPLKVTISELSGCTAYIADDGIRYSWQAYHSQHCQLRLITKAENLALPKLIMPWAELMADIQ